MGVASKKLAGLAEGRAISAKVKELWDILRDFHRSFISILSCTLH